MGKDRGIELACRFSLITNRLRYCGPKDAHLEFYNLIKGESYDQSKILDFFKKYEGLYVYLSAISKKLGNSLLDEKVVEAYWFGSESLERFTDSDMKEIISGLSGRGLPEEYSKELIRKLPSGLLPHHSFNVLYIGVGKTTGSVPTNLLTMNKCILSAGKVLSLKQGTLIVSYSPLVIKSGKMFYGKEEIQHLEYQKEVLPELKVGDIIAAHWDYACMKISPKESEQIKRYTQKTIDCLNDSLFFSND